MKKLILIVMLCAMTISMSACDVKCVKFGNKIIYIKSVVRLEDGRYLVNHSYILNEYEEEEN